MPLVVIDDEMSTRNGVVELGMPAAIGLGVITARVPPCGATLREAASELARISMKPASVARSR